MNSETDKQLNYLRNPYVLLSVILLGGFILRLFLSMFLTYEPDFDVWRGWGRQIAIAGFGGFYDRYWCDYMPGYLYVLWLLDNIHRTFPALSPEILFKLPANLSDVGISALIFFALRDITSVRNAMIAAAVYLFNPASLSNSTFWGQVDSFHTLPILFSVFLGLRKHFVLSGLFAATAFMIKPQSIVIFPVIGFIAIKPVLDSLPKIGFRHYIPAVKFVMAIIFSLIIITLPFIWDDLDSLGYLITGPVDLIRERFETAYKQYEFTSLNAFNFWGSFAMWVNDEILFLGLSYKTWGTLIFGSIYALLMGLLLRSTLLRRHREGKEFTYLIFETIALVLFSLFLFVTRAHERHLLPAIVFFTLITFRTWIFWYMYAIVSCVYVINMIYSYIQLTTKYSGVPENVDLVMRAAMFSLYLSAFIIVLIHFIIITVKYKNPVNSVIPRN
ncbi:MAG: hypothetical protein RIG61_03680 [Deltaproteobacteria bacterium]